MARGWKKRGGGTGGGPGGGSREEGGMTDYQARRQYDAQNAMQIAIAQQQGGTAAANEARVNNYLGGGLFDPQRWKAAKQFQNYYAKSGDVQNLGRQTQKLQDANIIDKAGNNTGVPKYEQLSGTNDGGVFSKATTQEAVDRAMAQRQKRIDTMLVGMVY